jgi:hypothetical protein
LSHCASPLSILRLCPFIDPRIYYQLNDKKRENIVHCKGNLYMGFIIALLKYNAHTIQVSHFKWPTQLAM